MNNQAADAVRARVVRVMKRVMSEDPEIRSRNAFALRIGTTKVTVYRWENDTGSPTVDNIVNLCVEFGVSPSYLLLGKGDMFGKEADPISTRILHTLSRLERKMDAKPYRL